MSKISDLLSDDDLDVVEEVKGVDSSDTPRIAPAGSNAQETASQRVNPPTDRDFLNDPVPEGTKAGTVDRTHCETCGKKLVWNPKSHRVNKRFCGKACSKGAPLYPKGVVPTTPIPATKFEKTEWEILKALAACHADRRMVSAYLHITPAQLDYRLKQQKSPDHENGWTWSEFSAEYQQEGKATILIKMYEDGISNSRSAAASRIFLAKNWLGYADRSESRVTRFDGDKADLSKLSPEDRKKRMLELMNKAGNAVSDSKGVN